MSKKIMEVISLFIIASAHFSQLCASNILKKITNFFFCFTLSYFKHSQKMTLTIFYKYISRLVIHNDHALEIKYHTKYPILPDTVHKSLFLCVTFYNNLVSWGMTLQQEFHMYPPPLIHMYM